MQWSIKKVGGDDWSDGLWATGKSQEEFLDEASLDEQREVALSNERRGSAPWAEKPWVEKLQLHVFEPTTTRARSVRREEGMEEGVSDL